MKELCEKKKQKLARTLLALFLVPSLLLGLMLRKPVIRFNDWVIRNLENTKVM